MFLTDFEAALEKFKSEFFREKSAILAVESKLTELRNKKDKLEAEIHVLHEEVENLNAWKVEQLARMERAESDSRDVVKANKENAARILKEAEAKANEISEFKAKVESELKTAQQEKEKWEKRNAALKEAIS